MIEKYRDDHGTWRWRLKARDGEIIAESGQAYPSKLRLNRAISSFFMVAGEDYRQFTGGLELKDYDDVG